MNDTGGGVTAIHDVPGDITRIGFHWMLFFPFCHSKGASICSSHGVSRRSRGFFVPNFRIFELFLHTENRGGHGFFCPDFFPCPEFANFFFTRSVAEVTGFLCHEFSNFRIFSSHGRSRRSRIFFIPRLVLGPTDQREVIAEFLSITRSVADGCGACSSCEWGLFVVVYRPIRGVCV